MTNRSRSGEQLPVQLEHEAALDSLEALTDAPPDRVLVSDRALPQEPALAKACLERAVGRSGDDDQDTEIRTQYLELDPERYIAETEERVQIRIGARSLTATGMLASLNDNTVELKSNVETIITVVNRDTDGFVILDALQLLPE